MNQRHQCPICGFKEMPYPASDYNICPCCGTEFGLDDVGFSNQEIRARWIRGGMPWFGPAALMPASWNPINQLVNAGLAEVLVNNLQKPEPVKSVSYGGPINIVEEISIGFSGSILSHA